MGSALGQKSVASRRRRHGVAAHQFALYKAGLLQCVKTIDIVIHDLNCKVIQAIRRVQFHLIHTEISVGGTGGTLIAELPVQIYTVNS